MVEIKRKKKKSQMPLLLRLRHLRVVVPRAFAIMSLILFAIVSGAAAVGSSSRNGNYQETVTTTAVIGAKSHRDVYRHLSHSQLTQSADDAISAATPTLVESSSGVWAYTRVNMNSSSSNGRVTHSGDDTANNSGAAAVYIAHGATVRDSSASTPVDMRTSMPFYLGVNHFNAIRRCKPYDHECLEANLFHDKYDGNITLAATAVESQFKRWSFTGAGYNAPPEMMAKMPFYTALFLLSNSSGGPQPWHVAPARVSFPDPWSRDTISSIRASVQERCRENAPYRHNNLGYLLIDFPAYDIVKSQQSFGYDWVSTLRCCASCGSGSSGNKSSHSDASGATVELSTSPGYQRYADFLRTKYGNDPTAVCRAYGVDAANCSNGYDRLDLCGVKSLNTAACLRDDYEFLPEIADQIYQTAETALHHWHGPDAVIFGDTVVLSWAPDGVLQRAAKRFHGQSVQPAGGMIMPSAPWRHVQFNRTEWDRIHNLIGGRPILVADLGFAFPRPPYRTYEWGLYTNQTEAAAAYRSWVLGAAKTPYIVGFQKCQYIDRAVAQPELGLKMGLVNFNGTEHEPFVSLVASANADALETRASMLSVSTTATARHRTVVLSNRALPLDTRGVPLFTGETSVLRQGKDYYMYVNIWGGCPPVDCCPSPGGCASCCYVPPTESYPDTCVFTKNHTVVAYRTRDFAQFEFMGAVLRPSARSPGIEFRPHVIFNEADSKYVMWFEDRQHAITSKGYFIALSTSPTGPFEALPGPVKVADTPGDFSLLVDTDGLAYHVQTTTNDPTRLRGFVITRLNSSYTGPATGKMAGSANITAPVPAEGPVLFRRTLPANSKMTMNSSSSSPLPQLVVSSSSSSSRYYILAGSTCCACRGGSNIIVFSAPSPLGPWECHGDVGSRNPHKPVDPHDPHAYVTEAQASDVVALDSGQYLWLGNQWVTGTRNDNNLLYWDVLEFEDSKGNFSLKQFVRKDNVTINVQNSAHTNHYTDDRDQLRRMQAKVATKSAAIQQVLAISNASAFTGGENFKNGRKDNSGENSRFKGWFGHTSYPPDPATPARLLAHASVQPLLAGYVDPTLAPYKAKGDGKSDDWQALQAAIADAYAARMTVLLPANRTFLLSRQLLLRQVNRSRDYGFQMIGRTAVTAERPVLRLQDGASGKSGGLPKNIFVLFELDQSGPLASHDESEHYQSRFRGIDIDLGDNPGAIGLSMSGAQMCSIADTTIRGVNFYAGISGLPGSGGFSANLAVIGGDYGIIQAQYRPNPSISGLVLSKQRRAGLVVDISRGPVVVSGFRIASLDPPAAGYRAVLLANKTVGKDNAFNGEDGFIIVHSRSNDAGVNSGSRRRVGDNNTAAEAAAAAAASTSVAADTIAAIETHGADLVLRNVSFLASGPQIAVTAGCFPGTPRLQLNASSFPPTSLVNVPLYVLTGSGATVYDRNANISRGRNVTQHLGAPLHYNQSAPPAIGTDIVPTEHSWSARQLPYWWQSGTINAVTEYGATPQWVNSTDDDSRAIQSALNDSCNETSDRFGQPVFVPHGIYNLARPIDTHGCTHLIGAGTHSTIFAPMSSLQIAKGPLCSGLWQGMLRATPRAGNAKEKRATEEVVAAQDPQAKLVGDLALAGDTECTFVDLASGQFLVRDLGIVLAKRAESHFRSREVTAGSGDIVSHGSVSSSPFPSHTAALQSKPTTPYFIVRGEATGRFYGLPLDAIFGGTDADNGGPLHVLILVNGTGEGAVHFYNPSTEHLLNDKQVLVTGATSIHFHAWKYESSLHDSMNLSSGSLVRIEHSQNVTLFGGSGNYKMLNTSLPMIDVRQSSGISVLGMVRRAAWDEPKTGNKWLRYNNNNLTLSGYHALLMFRQ